MKLDGIIKLFLLIELNRLLTILNLLLFSGSSSTSKSKKNVCFGKCFLEYKKQNKIYGAIITSYKSEKDFKIATYCPEKNICVRKGKGKIYRLSKKHAVHYLSSSWDIDFDISQIISIKAIKQFNVFVYFLKKD